MTALPGRFSSETAGNRDREHSHPSLRHAWRLFSERTMPRRPQLRASMHTSWETVHFYWRVDMHPVVARSHALGYPVQECTQSSRTLESGESKASHTLPDAHRGEKCQGSMPMLSH